MKPGATRTPVLIIVLVLLASVTATLYPRPITFNVKSRTEILSAVVAEGARSRWHLADVQLQRSCEGDVDAFSGSLELADGTRVTIQRIASGPMRIRLLAGEANAVGDLYDEADEFLETLADCTLLVVRNPGERANKGQTLVLPITGDVEIGQEVRFQSSSSSPLLKSATISMLSQPLFNKSRFDAGRIELDTGDAFSVKDPLSPAFGFVLVDGNAGMSGIFRLKGTTGQVVRFGAEGYEVQTPLWTRLANDPVLTGIWIVFLFLLKYLGLMRKWLSGENRNA